MGKKYSEEAFEHILKKEIKTSALTEEKIQEAYQMVRAEAEKNKKVSTYLPKRKKWVMPVATASVLLVSTITVTATMNGFFSKSMERKEDTAYKFEVNYELTPYRMTVTPEYIPEGYRETEELKYCKDEFNQNGISICVVTADYLALYGDTPDISNVKSIEKSEIQGMEADLITLNYDKERISRTFDKRIYLFNEAEGYVGIVYGGNDLDMKTLVKVAENLTFVKSEERVQKIDAEEVEKQKAVEAEGLKQEEIREKKKWEAGISKEQMQKVGVPFKWGMSWDANSEGFVSDAFEITVLDNEVVDNISEFSADKFYVDEDIAKMLKEDGTLKPYERITMSRESFYPTAEDKEISRETVGQKFLKVRLRVRNLSDSKQEFWAGAPELLNLKQGKKGSYRYSDTYAVPLNQQEYGICEKEAPQYFDQSTKAVTDSSYFFRELESKETLEYTAGFLVDEDKVENLYLDFGSRMSCDEEDEKNYEKYVKME